MSQKSPARQDPALHSGDKRQFCMFCHGLLSDFKLLAQIHNMYCMRELRVMLMNCWTKTNAAL